MVVDGKKMIIQENISLPESNLRKELNNGKKP